MAGNNKPKNQWLSGILSMNIGHSQTFKHDLGTDVWQRVPGGWIVKTFPTAGGCCSVYIPKKDGQMVL